MTSPDPKPPLHKKSRTLVAENSKFDLFFDHLILPQGESIPNFLVVSPQKRMEDGTTGVAILPVLNDQIALIRVYRHAIEDWSWEIPRGFVESGENFQEGAQRELLEETGMSCPIKSLVSLGSFRPDAGILDAKVQLVAALHCEIRQPFAPNETGHQEMQTLTPNEILDWIERGHIHDPSTLIAFYKYEKIKHTL
jgi:ADP-ribose pyrophosphatase